MEHPASKSLPHALHSPLHTAWASWAFAMHSQQSRWNFLYHSLMLFLTGGSFPNFETFAAQPLSTVFGNTEHAESLLCSRRRHFHCSCSAGCHQRNKAPAARTNKLGVSLYTRVVPKVTSNFFFACELATADEGEWGGRWNQPLCYP